MKREPDLIWFFRRYDIKENWVLDAKIEKILRENIKATENKFKKAFTEMWEKGNIPGDIDKRVNYVYLIRNLELYSNLELFKMIIAQKANETGRKDFYDKYKKG